MQGYERDQWRGSGYGPRGDMDEGAYAGQRDEENKSQFLGAVGVVAVAVGFFVIAWGDKYAPSKLDTTYPNAFMRLVYNIKTGDSFVSEEVFYKNLEEKQHQAWEDKLAKMPEKQRREEVDRREKIAKEFELFGFSKDKFSMLDDMNERTDILRLAALSDKKLKEEITFVDHRRLSKQARKELDQSTAEQMAEIRMERDSIVAGKPIKRFKPDAWDFSFFK